MTLATVDMTCGLSREATVRVVDCSEAPVAERMVVGVVGEVCRRDLDVRALPAIADASDGAVTVHPRERDVDSVGRLACECSFPSLHL